MSNVKQTTAGFIDRLQLTVGFGFVPAIVVHHFFFKRDEAIARENIYSPELPNGEKTALQKTIGGILSPFAFILTVGLTIPLAIIAAAIQAIIFPFQLLIAAIKDCCYKPYVDSDYLPPFEDSATATIPDPRNRRLSTPSNDSDLRVRAETAQGYSSSFFSSSAAAASSVDEEQLRTVAGMGN